MKNNYKKLHTTSNAGRSSNTKGPRINHNEVRPWAALWAVSAGFFMIMLDTTIVAIAQPQLQANLHTSLSLVIWASTAYMVAYAVPMLFTGRLGDQYGPRIIYVSGLIVFTIASAWCGFSTSISMLIAARIVQGLGAALMGPQTLAVVNRLFTGKSRGYAMSAWSAVQGSATLLGPILGGFFVSFLNWRWIFFVNIPIGLIAVFCALRFIPHFAGHSHRFDLPGIVLSFTGLTALILTIQEGTSLKAPAFWALLVGAFALLTCFVLSQLRQNEVLIPLRLFRNRDFSLSIAALILSSLAVNAQLIPVMYYLQRVMGMSALLAALTAISMPVATVVLARFVGKTIARLHPAAILTPAFLLATTGSLILQYAMNPGRSTLLIATGYAVFGVGIAFVWPPLATYSLRRVAPTDHGAASGIFNTMRIVGGVIGMAAMGAIIEMQLASLGSGGGQAKASAVLSPGPYRTAYSRVLETSTWLPVVSFAIGAVISLGFAFGKTIGPNEEE